MITDLSIHFTNDWALWAVLAATLGLSLACLAWTRRALGAVEPRWTWIFFVLKWLSLLLLIGFLVNPVLSYRIFRTRRAGVAILVDTSRSMSVKDSLGGASRFDAAKGLLFDSNSNFLSRLGEIADPYFYVFDTAAAPVPAERLRAANSAEGNASNLATALNAVARQRTAQNLIGLVLLSDGQDNGGEDPQVAATQTALPVYSVGVGKKDETKNRIDRRLTAVRTNPVVARNAEAVARVTVEHDGFAGDVVDLQMLDEGTVVAAQRVVLSDKGSQEADLTYKPARKGQRTYRVEIPHAPADAIPENDALEFSVLVSDTKIKLLYVEGALRWEYKFFKRFLETDPSIEPAFIIRTGGNKISMTGVENVRLEGGLPTPLDALGEFKVVIIGDVDKNLLSPAALGRLQSYVSDKGGGVLFLAGYHTMLSGEFKDTPLDKLLPVQIRTSSTRPPARPATLRPTALGRSHDVLIGLAGLIDGRKVTNAYSVGKPKPGATELIEQRSEAGGGAEPLLVAQTYGKGRAMMLAADRLWQWDFAAGDAKTSVADAARRSGASRLWGQMTRWLAQQEIEGEVTDPLVTAYTDQTYYQPGEAVTVNVNPNIRAIGKDKLDLDAALYSGDRKIASIPMQAAGDGKVLRGSARPPADGACRIEVKATAGEKTSSVDLKFNVGKPYKEMEQMGLNEDLLRGLAQQTNGGYYSLMNAGEILQRIQAGKTQTEHRAEIPLVNSWACFFLFLILVFAEWSLRRRKQLI